MAAPRVGIAVSGGPDSLGLAALAQAWAVKNGAVLHALIVDHGLRAESGSEAGEVQQRLLAHGVPTSVLTWHRPDQLNLNGKQRAARWARYALMADAAQRLSLDRVWLGHTLEDQAETLWMRWLAGSGLWGLAGLSAQIQLFGTLYERPLLGLPHADLRQLAEKTFGIDAIVDDPTNRDKATWRGRARSHYGRGLRQLPDTQGLITTSVEIAQWRRFVEAKALSIGADATPLSADNIQQYPAACAVWLCWQSQNMTQREFAISFDDALGLVHALAAEIEPAVSRGRRTIGGVLVKPVRQPSGQKAWQVCPEDVPPRRQLSAHNPGYFWQRLFKDPSALLVKQAYTSQRPLFTIATSSFATTLD